MDVFHCINSEKWMEKAQQAQNNFVWCIRTLLEIFLKENQHDKLQPMSRTG